jgi:anti-anti-sigma factor
MTETVATRDANKAVIRPGGDIVASSADELRGVMRAMAGEGVDQIVVDLSNVHMVDSRGIGLLVAAHNTMRKANGRLEVIHASREILDMMRTMRIHQHFSITGD